MSRRYAIVTVVLLFLLFTAFECGAHKTRASVSYKVLEVVEGDMMYVDFNTDGKKDPDELLHLKNVDTFPLKFNNKTESYAKKYNLAINEAVTLGFVAKEFSKDLLEGQQVAIINGIDPYNKNYRYRFATVVYNGKDFSKVLLNNGLAFAHESNKFNPYKAYESEFQIKETADAFLKLDVKIVDDRYKIFHNPDCKKTLKIKEYRTLPLKLVSTNYKKCYYCLDIQKQKCRKYDYNLHYDKNSREATFGNISIYSVNPTGFDRPSTLCRTGACRALVKSIDKSSVSIDFALYGMDRQDEIIDALKRAKSRGVRIRGVSDSYPDGSYYYKDTRKLCENFDVKLDYSRGLMHNKFFIFDNKKVFTGTMNMSITGSGGYNANTVLLINSSYVAEIYTKEFNQMYEGHFQKHKENHSVKNIKLGDGTILSIYFSPKGNVYNEAISPLLKGAKKEIYVSIFYLTHKEIIQDLIDAKKRGVDVRVILDSVGASQFKQRIELLRSCGVLVKVENWGGKDHEKNIVVDKKYLLTGSANFSQSAMGKNDENLLVINNPKIAAFYVESFMNLYNSISHKYLKRFPRAESFESGNSCYDGIDNNFDTKIDSEDLGCKKR